MRVPSSWRVLAVLALLPLLAVPARPASAARLAIGGFVAPSFKLTARPNAQPVDRLDVGFGSTRAGLIFVGEPTDHWRFEIDLVIGADTIEALVDVGLVDVDNDGSVDDVTGRAREAVANIVEETTIAWMPVDQLHLRFGRMRIPFTSQAQVHNMSLLFGDRADASELFLKGGDLGGLLEFRFGEGHLMGSVGLFNGTDLAAGKTSEKGVLVTGRLDVHPLGDFDHGESSMDRSPFRLGIGGGIVYHPFTSYDSAGEPDVRVRDMRVSVSLRMKVRGLSLVAEALFRYQTDSLTSRPVRATGAYGQLGVYIPIGLEPAFRVGWIVEDQTFDPRHALWLRGGINFYPTFRDENPDLMRISIMYNGEDRITEQEWAHGVVLGGRLKW